MKFSDFAQILYSIVGGEKYNFTIELLKAGLDDAGVEYIKSLRSDESGKSRIRKLLSGKNDITEIAIVIVTFFHDYFFVDYILERFDESQYSEICEKFRKTSDNQITIEEDDVPQRLAEVFYDILNEAAKGKSVKVKNDKSHAANNNMKNPEQNNSSANTSIIQSYTITESEKIAIKNICDLISKSLKTIKQKTDEIDRKQFELKNISDSETDQRWKEYLEYDLKSRKEKFNVSYSELEVQCADVVKLLESKKHLNKSLNKIYDIAVGINNDKYKITSSKSFSYAAFSVMVSDYYKNYKLLLRCIDDF